MWEKWVSMYMWEGASIVFGKGRNDNHKNFKCLELKIKVKHIYIYNMYIKSSCEVLSTADTHHYFCIGAYNKAGIVFCMDRLKDSTGHVRGGRTVVG